MLTKDHLTLELMRLRPAEQWEPKLAGLFFFFVKAGAGEIVIAAAKQSFGPGDMFVLEGGVQAKIRVAASNELVFWWFSANLEHFFPLFQADEISLLQNIFDNFKGIKFYSASKRISEECQKMVQAVPPQFNLDHRCQVLRIAASVLTLEFDEAQNQRVGFIGVDEHLNSVFEKLSVDELLSFSVGELAKRFGCSRRHLNRLFHYRFGFSVAALRMEMRLIKAASLLRCDNIKIINLAEQCGFNHMGLFNTCFKRRFGATPSQWRNEMVSARLQSNQRKSVDTDCPLRSNGLCPWNGTDKAVKSSHPHKATKSAGTAVMFRSNLASQPKNETKIKHTTGKPIIEERRELSSQPSPRA